MIVGIGHLMLISQLSAAPDCGAIKYHGIINKTESLVLKKSALEFTSEGLGNSRNACVRIEFLISKEGRAVRATIVASSGVRALDAAAIKALEQYRFCRPVAPHKGKFMLVFRPRGTENS